MFVNALKISLPILFKDCFKLWRWRYVLMCGYVYMRKDAYRVQRRMSPGPRVTCGCELPKMGATNNKYP